MNTRKVARVVAAATAAFLAAGALAACTSEGEAEGLTKVTFGISTNMGANNSPVAVAQHFGFFEEEGLDFEMVVTGDSTASVQGVVQGRLDLSSTPPEPIFQVQSSGDSGAELVLVYNYVRQQTGSLAVLSSSGISSLEDFAGTTIGVSDLASSNMLLTNGALATVGLKQDVDYEYLAVGFGAAALQALQAGHVDALAMWDTEYASMEKAGAELEYFTTPEIESLFSTTFFTSRDFMDENPEIVAGFGRAMAKATYFTTLDPEATLRIMYEDYPETLGAGRTVEEQLEVDLTALSARVKLLGAGDPNANRTWGLYEPAAVEAWANFAYNAGIIANPLEVDTVYTNEFVEKYNDFAPADVEKLLK